MTRRLPHLALSAAILLLLAAASTALARPGAPDLTFGGDGVVRSEFGPTFNQIAFTSLDPQSDDSFLAGLRQGSEGGVRIRRYLADGSRDQAYGEKWTNEPPEAVQADGKTLRIDCGNSLVRFEVDGTPDPTFGDHPCGSHMKSDEVPFNIERILPLASGDILVAGKRMHYVPAYEEPEYVFEQLAIARYDKDGKLDASFGDDGVTLLDSEFGFGGKRLLGIGIRPGGGVVVIAADTVKSWFGDAVDRSGTSLLGLSASGVRDSAYGSSGVAHLDGLVIAFQSLGNGSILLAGDAWDTPLGVGSINRSDLFLARYGDDGTPDPTFGDDGIATADFEDVDLAGALQVEDNGSAIVGGAATDTDNSYCLRFRGSCGEVPVLAKFTADGAEDPSFGDGGRMKLESLAYPFGAISGGVGVKALATLPGEGVLVGGGSGPDAFLAAMSQDGAFDGNFGAGGVVREREPRQSDNTANSLGVDRYGRVLIAGATDAGLAGRRPTAAIFRYLPNGSLDDSFGNGLGYVRVPAAAHISVAPDGSSVAASGDWPYTVTKLKASGEIDASFGEDGTTQIRPAAVRAGRLVSIVLLPGGETILAGNDTRHGRRRIVLFRLRRDGRPNRSFGQNGVEVLELGPNHRCGVTQMAVRRDGGIVLAGYVYGAPHGERRETLAVAQLKPNGARDHSFGGDGLVVLHIGHQSYATAVTVGRVERILVGGLSSNDRSAELLLRLNANGNLDRGFARGGIARTPIRRRRSYGPQTILVDPDRIIVARETRDRQVRAFQPNGRPVRSFPLQDTLNPHHALAAPPIALQGDRLLVLERGYSIIEPSFTLRGILLR